MRPRRLQDDEEVRAGLRDLIAFELKLFVDGLKDIVLAPLAIVAFVMDALMRSRGGSRQFLRVMRLGMRFEAWLRLYDPIQDDADEDDEGASVARRFIDANRVFRTAERHVFTRRPPKPPAS
jgi:hypothetical protein